MIKLMDIEKIYKTDEIETYALNKVSLEINSGDFTAIMGPSGCGKSTLLSIIGLLDKHNGGKYFFNDKEISGYSKSQLANLRKGRIGFIFQSFNLINELSVYENIELPLLYLKIPAKKRKEQVLSMLDKLSISHRKNHYPNQLSGGQQQRVATGRAIIMQPELILADEPTGNLDSKNGTEVMKLITSLNEEGTTVLMVTHSREIGQYANKTIKMFDGSIVAQIR